MSFFCSVFFLFSFFINLLCSRLNWLPVGFWLHVEHLHSDSDAGLLAILPGECGLASFLLNTIPPCPSQTGEWSAVEEKKWRESTFHNAINDISLTELLWKTVNLAIRSKEDALAMKQLADHHPTAAVNRKTKLTSAQSDAHGPMFRRQYCTTLTDSQSNKVVAVLQ